MHIFKVFLTFIDYLSWYSKLAVWTCGKAGAFLRIGRIEGNFSANQKALDLKLKSRMVGRKKPEKPQSSRQVEPKDFGQKWTENLRGPIKGRKPHAQRKTSKGRDAPGQAKKPPSSPLMSLKMEVGRPEQNNGQMQVLDAAKLPGVSALRVLGRIPRAGGGRSKSNAPRIKDPQGDENVASNDKKRRSRCSPIAAHRVCQAKNRKPQENHSDPSRYDSFALP